MYRTASGEEIFVIDGHTHFWDGSPANQKNVHGKQFIECFYAYHANLSPPSERWPKEKFEKYDAKTMFDDLFVDGYDDMAILQPTYLTDFYKNGFNTTERNSALKKKHPDRFILNGAFDPRDGSQGARGSACTFREAQDQGRQALHGRMARRVQGLQAHRQGVLPVPRGGAEARHQERPRPQGPDDPAAQPRRLRRRRHRRRRDLVPGPQLHRRTLRLAAP